MRLLLWLVHVGPGVGNSETLEIMAEQLGGDTIHHCSGISTGGLKSEVALWQKTKHQTEVPKAEF